MTSKVGDWGLAMTDEGNAPGSEAPREGDSQGEPLVMSTDARAKSTPWLLVAVAVAALVIGGALWMRGRDVDVPDVTGRSESEAVAALEAAGLRAGQVSEDPTLGVEPGLVTTQSPAPGMKAPEGSAVSLAVSAIPLVEVPDVEGKATSEAEAELAGAGLRVGDTLGEPSADVPPGSVIAQSPEAGDEVPVATTVALVVSTGPTKDAVPDVVGLTSADAEDALAAAGFESKESKQEDADVEAGDVVRQSPAAGTVAVEGSTVDIVVSKGAPEPEAPADDGAADEEGDDEGSSGGGTRPPGGGSGDDGKPADEPSPSLTEVPDVVGARALEAVATLKKAKLVVRIEWGPTDTDFLMVIGQEPTAGTAVDKGSQVTITIGLPSFLFDVQANPLPASPEEPAPSTPATP